MILGLEILSLLVMGALGVYSSLSDLQTGRISNKVLAAASIYALVADIILYGMLADDLRLLFISNIVLLTGIAMLLFFTHSWAGGDCKLLCVLGLLSVSYTHLGCTGVHPQHICFQIFAWK